MQRGRIFLICLLGMGLVAGPAASRVFWRRTASGPAVLDSLPGWRTVYRADVRINGRPGALHIAACDEAAPAAAERLRGAWRGGAPAFQQGAGISTGTARAAGRVSRFLLLEMPNTATTLVFVLEQSEEDYRASLAPPGAAGLAGWPVYPGSLPRLRVENGATGAGLAVMTAGASAAAAADFYREALAARGFQPLLPEPSGGRDRSLLIYGKGRALCCVLASEGGGPAQSTITLLCRNLEMD